MIFKPRRLSICLRRWHLNLNRYLSFSASDLFFCPVFSVAKKMDYIPPKLRKHYANSNNNQARSSLLALDSTGTLDSKRSDLLFPSEPPVNLTPPTALTKK